MSLTAQTARSIGIIGCSAEGAALCYRTICRDASARLGPHAHPEIVTHTPSLALYVAALDAGDLETVGGLIARSAELLAAAGAQILIIPDNTIHQALAHAGAMPRPFIHIAESVADAAEARGLRRLGLLGTRWLMASEVYPRVFGARGLAVVRPEPAAGEAVSEIIMDELVAGRITEAARARLTDIVAGLAGEDCDGVILGCTELPLILGDTVAGLPTLDSTRLLARAALLRSLE